MFVFQKLVLFIIVAALIVLVSNQVFDLNQFDIVEELREHCSDTEHYTPNEVGSFPKCVTYPTVTTINCNPLKCPPGYRCVAGASRNNCRTNLTSCAVWHFKGVDTTNYHKAARRWKPTCLSDDTWAPKQCKGERANGMCYCFNPLGERLFGQQFSRLADDMTCACSLQKWRMDQTLNTAESGRSHSSLHCDQVGNYEPLQCDSGLCWCVEPKTGRITAPVSPQDMVKFLPCYNAPEIGSQYLRQCESQLYAQKDIIFHLTRHGTKFNNFAPLLCDADGTYGKYKIISGLIYCTWKDNSNIGSWAGELNNINVIMDCNCARDTRFFSENGQTQTLQCQPNGNYQSPQMINLKWHCVDSDGFVTTFEDNITGPTGRCDRFK